MTLPSPRTAPGEGALPAFGGYREAFTETVSRDFDVHRWLEELLDPESWGEILSRFGHTMRLAVALTDTHGNLLGTCYNPQPVWSLVRKGGAPPGPGCPFCLIPNLPCTAVADALASGKVVCVIDAAGLAHAAIPLFLGSQPLGALIAGQTFAQYPQPLSLHRIAKSLGASREDVWTTAIRQVPLSFATLGLYAELLASLGQAFLRQRYAVILARKLDETDQRYRMMIDGSKDHALFTVNGKGYVTGWNRGAERLLGYTEAEITGENYRRFFTPEDVREGIDRRGIRMAEQRGWIEEEGWQVRKDGTRFLSETVTARLGEGDFPEYGRLLHDVTKARKATEAALEAQKLETIGILAGGIAHDFNNLLTGILGNVSLAIARLPADDASRALLEIAERSGHKAAGLIGQLLDYAGKKDSIVTQFSLSRLISEILPLIETSISKTVSLHVSLQPDLSPPDLTWIAAEASAVQQIVMNLVINGAEAIGSEGGSVHVSAGVVDDSLEKDRFSDVYLEVRDSGCGMDETTKRRIFDPFFTTKFTGRGLGLAAVSGIVRRLNGRLSVESEVGQGSTFRVVFPGVAAPVPEAKKPAIRAPSGGGTILVVEDEPMIRNLARAILERYGYSVLVADNGQTGVDIFRGNLDAISAVLLDLTMPVMGGQEAFRLMKAIRPDIPIIIASGYSEAAISQEFGRSLAGVIQKPYTLSTLGDKIAVVLALGKSEDVQTAGGVGI